MSNGGTQPLAPSHATGLRWRRGAAVPRRRGHQSARQGRSGERGLQGRRATPGRRLQGLGASRRHLDVGPGRGESGPDATHQGRRDPRARRRLCDGDDHATPDQWHGRDRYDEHHHDHDDDVPSTTTTVPPTHDHDDRPADDNDDHHDGSHHRPVERADTDSAGTTTTTVPPTTTTTTVPPTTTTTTAPPATVPSTTTTTRTAHGGGRCWGAAGLHRLVRSCNQHLTTPDGAGKAVPETAAVAPASGSAGQVVPSESGGGDDGAVEVVPGHGPVVRGIAVREDGSVRRGHPVAPAVGVGEDGGGRVDAPDRAHRTTV